MACHACLLHSVWNFCVDRDIWVTTAYIPGVENVEADEESRKLNLDAEWKLNSNLLSHALQILEFEPEMDLFASRINRQYPRYVAYRPDPEAVHITKRYRGVGSLSVGVVTSSPDRLTVPLRACEGWESAVAVYRARFFDHGDERHSGVGKALDDLPVDSRVGVSLDRSRRLHLHVNGTDRGVVPCRSLPDPCWALWELDDDYPEITSLPVRYLS